MSLSTKVSFHLDYKEDYCTEKIMKCLHEVDTGRTLSSIRLDPLFLLGTSFPAMNSPEALRETSNFKFGVAQSII